MSEVEFYLGIARALMPNLEKAAVFINRVFAKTVNQRLRFLLQPAIEAIERRDVESAAQWLDRAILMSNLVAARAIFPERARSLGRPELYRKQRRRLLRRPRGSGSESFL
jgi:hypothetical protein